METTHRQRARRIGLRGVLLVLAPVLAVLALPAAPASASSNHTMAFSALVDIKDDDVGQDDWCRRVPYSDSTSGRNHTDGPEWFYIWDQFQCDEVRINVAFEADLMSDERLCNIRLHVWLYEGTSREGIVDDLDGEIYWNGRMNFCIGNGGSLHWDVVRVDNTAESEPDHGWVRDLTFTHNF